MEPTIIQPQQNQPQDETPVEQVQVNVTPPSAPTEPQAPIVADESQAAAPQPQVPYAALERSELFAPAPPTPAQSAKSGRSPLKMAAFVLVPVALVVGGYFANVGITKVSQKNAQSSAMAFIKDLNSGNTGQAYKLASADLRSQQSESDFASSMSGLNDSQPSFSNEQVSFDGDTATYVVNEDGLPETQEGSTTGVFTISLVKSGPVGWKVDNAIVE